MKTRPRFLIAIVAFTGTLAAIPTHADDASCKPLIDAAAKMARTPYHEVATVDGKPFEKIYTTTTLSMRLSGNWTTVPMTPKEVLESMQETGSYSNCRVLRTEVVDGQEVVRYSDHKPATGTWQALR